MVELVNEIEHDVADQQDAFHGLRGEGWSTNAARKRERRCDRRTRKTPVKPGFTGVRVTPLTGVKGEIWWVGRGSNPRQTD